MGTEVGRELFGENFWVEKAIASVPDGTRAVFTDCRFPNEADAVRELNGQVWRIERAGFGPINNHPSETSLDNYKFDQYINNDEKLESLEDKVARLLHD